MTPGAAAATASLARLLGRSSDERLGSRLAAGEAAAFDELFRRYAHRLAAYGAHLLGDTTAGDDVAQSTLLKAYGALRQGHVPDRVRPWLFRIAHNTALDLLARRRELPTPDPPEVAAGGAESHGGALLAALVALPRRQRDVYVLRELHGLRIAEAAAELSLTPAQVEQALFAARNRLAEHLVFGERLGCAAVQRLAAGPLDAQERRALKTHLRSCASCRDTVALPGVALGPVHLPSLAWLRGLLPGAAAGGAPAAAKVGAVVAAASLVAGVPSALERMPHPAERAAAASHPATVRPTRRAPTGAAPVTPLGRWRLATRVRARGGTETVPHREGEAGRSDAGRDGGAADPGEMAAPETRDRRQPSATESGDTPTITTATTIAQDGGSSGDVSTDGSGATTAGDGGGGGATSSGDSGDGGDGGG